MLGSLKWQVLGSGNCSPTHLPRLEDFQSHNEREDVALGILEGVLLILGQVDAVPTRGVRERLAEPGGALREPGRRDFSGLRRDATTTNSKRFAGRETGGFGCALTLTRGGGTLGVESSMVLRTSMAVTNVVTLHGLVASNWNVMSSKFGEPSRGTTLKVFGLQSGVHSTCHHRSRCVANVALM